MIPGKFLIPLAGSGSIRFFLAAGLLLLYWLFPFTVDDAFISMRYAENLALGEGAVFNPGERVEGFSSPLWVFLLAILSPLPGDLLIYAKLLGCILYVWLGLSVYRVAIGVGASPALALLFFAGSLPVAIWGVSGMETLLYSLLVLYLFEAAYLGERRQVRLFFLLSAALLSRPEAPIPIFLALAWLGWKQHLSPRLLVAFALAAGGLAALRYGYFGEGLPNTFYAKSYQTPDRWHITFTNYIGGYFLKSGLVFPIAAMALALLSPLKTNLLFLSFVAGQIFFCLYVGGDWMPAWRFIVPIIPVMCLMAALAGARWWEKYRYSHLAWVPLLLLVCHLGINARFAGEMVQNQLGWKGWSALDFYDLRAIRAAVANGNPNYLRAVEWLAREGEGYRSLAVGEAGFLCYYSRLTCLDLHGLTDKTIAKSGEYPNTVIGKKLPIQEISFADSEMGGYILAKNPDLFIVSDTETEGPRDYIMGGKYVKINSLGNFQIFGRSRDVLIER